LTGVGKAIELRIPMEEGQEGLTCLYVAEASTNRLAIFNPGHFYTIDDASNWNDDGWAGYGNHRTVQALLDGGFDVLVAFMPHYRPDDAPAFSLGTGDPHVTMFASLHPSAGSVWKYFIEPVVASVNYLLAQGDPSAPPVYSEIDMLGLSGGGWTTVITAAVDPRIRTSVHVAGSEPLDFWNEVQNDDEQTLPGLYAVAGYRDLYVLGASGAGRRQLQVLNRDDSCCFFPGWMGVAADGWDAAVNGYATAIGSRLAALGDLGSFQLKIDDTAVSHQISRQALSTMILPLLGASGRTDVQSD
jgi:hypothetical protein